MRGRTRMARLATPAMCERVPGSMTALVRVCFENGLFFAESADSTPIGAGLSGAAPDVACSPCYSRARIASHLKGVEGGAPGPAASVQ